MCITFFSLKHKVDIFQITAKPFWNRNDSNLSLLEDKTVSVKSQYCIQNIIKLGRLVKDDLPWYIWLQPTFWSRKQEKLWEDIHINYIENNFTQKLNTIAKN